MRDLWLGLPTNLAAPGPATSAKNPTGPGLPNQTTNDSKGRTPMVGGNTRDVEVMRRRALRELRTARDVMGEWTDLIRQAAEKRVGSAEADDVLSDPSYWDAIGLYAQLNDAIARFAADGPRVQTRGVS